MNFWDCEPASRFLGDKEIYQIRIRGSPRDQDPDLEVLPINTRHEASPDGGDPR
jgi:hypothetical protein